MDIISATYNPVTSMEDVDDEQSITEVAFSGDEKAWSSSSKACYEDIELQRPISQRLRRLQSHFNTLLLVCIASLLAVVVWRGSPANGSQDLWQVGGDFTGVGPKFATHVVKWESDDTFVPLNASEMFSNETLARWQTLMPAGAGFGPAGESFSTTSMTHQLHCVYMMARMYSAATLNQTASLPADSYTHYLHCVDYLRQAIMCAGDVASELHAPTDGADNGPLDGGWNGRHVCKDYSQVIGYLDDQIKEGVRVVLPIDD